MKPAVSVMNRLNEQKVTAEKIEIWISYGVRLILLLAVLKAISGAQWSVLFPGLLALLLTFLPALVERKFRLSLPIEFECIFVIFVYAAVFLGEARGFYARYWWWDIMLHTISGLNLGFMGFVILFVFFSANKIKASALLIALFSFCFAVALGAVWEIYEYGMDNMFGLNMQKSGLDDTMWDLIVDSIGAFWASGLGFLYIKFNRGYVVKRLIEDIVRSRSRVP